MPQPWACVIPRLPDTDGSDVHGPTVEGQLAHCLLFTPPYTLAMSSVIIVA